MKKQTYIAMLICTLLIFATLFPVAVTMKENKRFETKETDIDDYIKSEGLGKIPKYIDMKDSVPANKKTTLAGPAYEFVQEPTAIMTSYYDYMPGSYVTHPLRVQTDNGDGHYLTFFGKESKNADRMQYWGYCDANGALQDWGKITDYTTWQGYGGIGIHPATGNCIATWHEDDDGNGVYDTAITYDDFYSSSAPGDWEDTVIVQSSGGNEYIWPHIKIGPSPMGEDYVRVYQITTNAQTNPAGFPCEDVRLMFIDIENTETADFSNMLNQYQWTTKTVFSNWRAKSCRPFQSFAVDYNNPGRIAFIGSAAWLDGDQGNMPVDEGVFVWESLDYGETWDKSNIYSDGPGAPIYYVNNPGFEEAPDQLEVGVFGYHGTAVFDSEGDLHWTYMQSYGWTDSEGSYYLPYFLPQAEVVWDGSEFTFREVPELPGTDSLSGHTVPWDEEGQYPIITWSGYRSGEFHENTQKNAVNLEKGWMAQMWIDSTYHQFALDEDPEYLDYKYHPIICISLSTDNGETWSAPIELTDIFNDKFDFSEQISVYPYMCDTIVDMGDDWGLIHMYYFDDNQFGSTVQGTGMDPTGQITYCSIKVSLGDNSAPTEPTVTYEKSSDSLIASSTDPDGDQIRYGVSWEDNQVVDEWTDYFASGEDATIDVGGRTGTVGVIAEDINGAQSDWISTTDRDRSVNSIWELFENFYLILQKLLKL